MDVYFYINLFFMTVLLWPAWKYKKTVKHDIAVAVIYLVAIAMLLAYPATFLATMVIIYLGIWVWFYKPGQKVSTHDMFCVWIATVVFTVSYVVMAIPTAGSLSSVIGITLVMLVLLTTVALVISVVKKN